MEVKFRYGKGQISLNVPRSAAVYRSMYTKSKIPAGNMLLESISKPVSSLPLAELLKKRKQGNIVIVVSDITRPIPYQEFLPDLIDYILSTGARQDEITILVATGMHRPSTRTEKVAMFGKDLVERIRITDHDAGKETELVKVEGKSWSGTEVFLNRHYVHAGFRILTGLVEPHFMAGFSGGRKSVCPGLASLKTVQQFHGFHFLSNPNASNGITAGNPLHMEAISVAKLCPADFAIHVVLDQDKEINAIISGEQFISHENAADYVKKRSFSHVNSLADLVITSCGGYPLDDTFYQCVKGFVNCLPAVKVKGEIIAFGKCQEGIGSAEYESLMKRYFLRHDEFLRDIENNTIYIRDQWQFQMHIRALEKIGMGNLHFYTEGILKNELESLSVTPHVMAGDELPAAEIQSHIDYAMHAGKSVALFPEGPYCSPLTI